MTVKPETLLRTGFDRNRWTELVEKIGPLLRSRTSAVPEDKHEGLSDTALVTLAGGTDLLDALTDAGLLVLDAADDRKHLRGAWAAMSTALHWLSRRQPLTPEVLDLVPKSHQTYLLGQQARAEHLDRAYTAMTAARGTLQELLASGMTPDPDQLGALLAVLGGTNPYTDRATPPRPEPVGSPDHPAGCWSHGSASGGQW